MNSWNVGILMDALFVLLLVMCSVSDLRKRVISNVSIIMSLCLGLAHTVLALLGGEPWWQHPVGMLLALPFFLSWLRNGIGAGDVKLIAVVGLYLGVLNTLVAFVLMIPILVVLLAYFWFKHKTIKQHIPLAPVISAGAIAALALGYLLKLAHH